MPSRTGCRRRWVIGGALVSLLWAGAVCAKAPLPQAPSPLPAGVTEYTVVAPRLGGTVRYLVWLPAAAKGRRDLPLIVMLHGLGGTPRGMLAHGRLTERLDAAIASGLLPPCAAVIPEGRDGYWTNWLDGEHPWADIITKRVLPAVQRRFPVAKDPRKVVIMGPSMGGFGALSVGLANPKLFGVIVALSPTDMAFAIAATPMRDVYTNVFGVPANMAAVRRVNPYHLARAGKGAGQHILLAYGSKEPRKFNAGSARLARELRRRKRNIEVLIVKGGRHGWASTWAQAHGFWLAGVGRALRNVQEPAGR